MIGQGVKARSRLETHFARVALRLLLEKDLGGKAFQDKVCAPLKILEVWDKLMRKRYGPVCSQSAAYARLMSQLQAYDGLQVVAVAMASGVPLHGTGPSNPGVVDCHALVNEFDRCRAGGLPPPARIPTAEELAREEEERKRAEDEKARAAKAAEEAAEARRCEQAQLEELEQGWLPMATPSATPADGGAASLQPPSSAPAAESAAKEDRRGRWGGAPEASSFCERSTMRLA